MGFVLKLPASTALLIRSKLLSFYALVVSRIFPEFRRPFKVRFALIALLLLFAGVHENTHAQTAANGSALFHGATYACYSCHSTGYAAGGAPLLPQLNAANVPAVLDHAIQNNAGGYMATFRSTAVDGGADGAKPLSASDRADIAAYLETVAGTGFPVPVSVAYHGATSAIPLKVDVTTGRFSSVTYSATTRGTVTAGTPIGYTSLQFTAGQQSTAVYTHTANNCTGENFTFNATGAAGNSETRTIQVTVTPPATPTASSTSPVAAAYNTATAIPITLGGGPTASIEIVSGLSNGGSLVTNGTASFTYTSNSGAYSASDSFTYRAVGPCAANSTNVVVNINISAPPAPVVSSAGTAAGNGGQPFNYQIAANNLPTSYSVTGTLPTGVSVNTSTGLISGTPTATGSFPVTVNATNAAGTGSKAVTITISTVTPVVTSSATASGTGGQAFSYQITANNLPTSYSVTGSLPAGVAVDTNTGEISGTPTATGTFPVTINATNSAGTGSQALTITISTVAPVVTSGTTAGGTGGQAFSYQITADNLPSSYSVTGSLPAGVSVNTSSGLISGTPTASGTFPVTINATNASGTGSQALTITITLTGPVVTSANTAAGTGGQAFSYQITADNLPTSFGVTGTLPAGVSVNTTTGLISGTPTASGTFPVTISATNAAGTSSQALTITISLVTPVITSANTATGTSGQAFSYQITANNLAASYGASGLPAGVGVNATTGLVSGTPSLGGTFNATVSATNAAGTGSQALTINLAFVAPTSGATAVAVPYETATPINLPVSGQFTQINITTPPTNGTAPTPAASSSTVTYTPLAGYTGTDSFSYSATGPGGTSAVSTISITVSTQIPTISTSLIEMVVPLNTATTFDLAPFIFGSSISGIAVASNPSHATVTVSGTNVVYTPANNYFGTDAFTFAAYGNGGTSQPATVNVRIEGRPDPTRDAAVTGLITSQVDTARRFSRTQISNFQGRMESLHRRGNTGQGNGESARFNVGPSDAAAAGAVQQGPGKSAGAAYQPAASLSADPMAGLLHQPTSSAANSMPAMTSAISAALSGLPQSDPAAILGNALLMATNAAQTSTLNLSANTGRADESSTLPDGVDVWIAGGVRFGTRDQTSATSAMKFTTDGVSVGADKRFRDDLALGVGLGYAQDKTNIGTDGTNSTAKSITIAGYGSYQPTENTFLDGLIGYGRLDYHTDRYVTPAAQFARSDRAGDFLFGSLTGGVEFHTTGLTLSPYGRLDLAQHRLKQATETGAGAFALSYASQNSPSVQFSLGLRADSAHETSFGWVAPRMRIELQRDFKGEQDAYISYADLPATRYLIPAASTNRNSLVLGVGSDFVFRRGLMLSLDYQTQRSSGQEDSQAVMFKMTKDLNGYSAPMPATFSGRGLGIRLDVGHSHDDNVSRANRSTEQLSDSAYNINLGKRLLNVPIGEHARLLANAFAGGEKFRRYGGLDRVFAGADAELQYRASGDFGTPTFGLFGMATAEQYESNLRDGHRFSGGISVNKPLTDRITIFGALSRNWRYARSAVFDTKDYSARLNLDYAITAHSTLYLTGEYRYGDIFSSGRSSLENINIADVLVRDDVFTSEQFFNYRFEGRTILLTIGYSLPLGPSDALDFSWRRIESTPSRSPGFATTAPRSYVGNQLFIVYLTKF